MTETRDFTNSEFRTFDRCLRKWWLAYYRKITPVREKSTGVRKLGTRLHLALAAYYRVGSKVNLIEVFNDTFHGDFDIAASTNDEILYEALVKDQELGVRMLEGYLQWVEEEGVDVGLNVYADEAEVIAPLPLSTVTGVPVRLRGRLDVRAHRELDDARVFMDHKSVGSFDQATATLAQDHQMLTYHLLELLEQTARGVPLEEMERCDGGLYNMLRRVKRTGAAKPPFYARETVHHNLVQLRNHYRQIHGKITRILELEAALDAGGDPQELCPPHVESSCTWSCDYFLVCSLFDDGSRVEDFIDRYFVGYDPLDRYIQSDGRQEDEGDG